MYDRHRLHLAMTWSGTTGTGSSISWSELYGCIIKANGNLDFFSKECCVGTALRVERTYLGGQLACGEGVTLDFTGRQHTFNIQHS